jgi:hypothetical protein
LHQGPNPFSVSVAHVCTSAASIGLLSVKDGVSLGQPQGPKSPGSAIVDPLEDTHQCNLLSLTDQP